MKLTKIAAGGGLTGDDLRLVFDRAVLAAKDVFDRTQIGEKSISIVSLAVRKMLAKAPDKSARVLLIGAGQTNNLVAKFLRKYGYTNVAVFNRSLGRAEQLAATFSGGSAFPLAELADYSMGFDVLYVCTAATESVVNQKNIGSLLAGETASGKLLIDLAVPNNVAEAVVESHAFHYISVDHLRQLADET
ncbi:MAG: hypothetical protein HC821_05740 [Lewinella sp.]|nr:hypothetical protein [Lewinella sp.]